MEKTGEEFSIICMRNKISVLLDIAESYLKGK
jgi:hypothetical protein